MTLRLVLSIVVLNLAWQWPRTIWAAAAAVSQATESRYKIERERRTPGEPPFGLERVGRPIVVVVRPTIRPEPAGLRTGCIRQWNGGRIARPLVPERSPSASRVSSAARPMSWCCGSRERAGDRRSSWPARRSDFAGLEAEAIARPDVDHQPRRPRARFSSRRAGCSSARAIGDARDRRDQPHARTGPDARLSARFESSPARGTIDCDAASAGVRAGRST